MKKAVCILLLFSWLFLLRLTDLSAQGQTVITVQNNTAIQSGANAQPGPNAQPPGKPDPDTLLQNIPVHDPVMIKQDSVYYVFCTGFGITMWSSVNRRDWRRESSVFSRPPQWAVAAVPGFKGHIWAPDISYYNGRYYLYYAVSAFGKNTSCIGLAVNKTLHTDSPDYKWEDLGKVIPSVPGRDMWNAIDPNLALDDKGAPWLAFGSFWNGIKLVKLNSDRLSLAEPEQWYTIASRPRDFAIADTLAGNAAIEAPFIFKKGVYYYLFVSFDYCCSRQVRKDRRALPGQGWKADDPWRRNDSAGRG